MNPKALKLVLNLSLSLVQNVDTGIRTSQLNLSLSLSLGLSMSMSLSLSLRCIHALAWFHGAASPHSKCEHWHSHQSKCGH